METDTIGDVLKRYDHDGYVVVRDVLDADLVEEARAHVDWLIERHPDTRPELLGTDLVADDPFWVRLVGDDRLLDVAEMFIGPNIALFASHYLCKPPGDGQPVLWHQDGHYWPLDPMEVVSLWLALDHVTPENGCMQVIPGSHRLDVQPHRREQEKDNVLSSEIEAEIDESEAADVILQPGDVEVHHPNIVHGSRANISERWRRGLTIRYIPTSTRILTDSPWPSAFLLRGESVEGVNTYAPKPRYVAERHMPFSGCDDWS